MADGEKTFTESEHLAILADRVATETAASTTELQRLTTEIADLQAKLDVAESAKVAAEQEREAAVQAHDTFKNEVTEREAAAARKGERLAKVKETAAHLPDEYFADENRIERIIAMSDDAFDAHVSDLAATAPKSTTTPITPPRETAMHGAPPVGAPASGNARSVLLGRFGAGAPKEG